MSTIGYLCQHRKTRRKRFPNLFFDRVDTARAVDHDNALGLARRELAISIANALVKFSGLLFHPIRFAGFKLHSRLSSRSIDVEHESDVRDANADGERIQALDDLAIQFACRSLINSCGIEEPIGNYAYATFERGLDYLAHELAATGLKQKQLGLGCHARIRSEEHTSELQSLRHLVCRLLLEKKKRITCMTALMSARWVNACGKLPKWQPARGAISAA